MNTKSTTRTARAGRPRPLVEFSRLPHSPHPDNSSVAPAASDWISSFRFPAAIGFWCSGLSLPLIVLAVGTCLMGCSFFKPAHDAGRHYVLTSLPATGPAKAAPGAVAVGLGQVKLPAYLFDTSLAVRMGTNEIYYLPAALWAERLDTGIQRVLAANLRTLLPTDQIRLSAWRSEDVGAGVYVSIEQFDVHSSGQAVLLASWRIVAPGGEKTLKAGESRFSRQGASPTANPSGAIATLSDLLADLSRELVQALQETTPPQRPAAATP